MTSGNPWKKVNPGDPLRIPATAYNAFLDVALANRRGLTGAGNLAAGARGDIVLVRNDSGGDVDRFAVLGIDAPLILPADNEDEFKRRVAFVGVTPAVADHSNGRIVITLHPIADGAIGLAIASGVVPCKVSGTGDDVEYADIEDGEVSYLSAAASGPVRVLWIDPAAAPERWAVVRLAQPSDGAVLIKITGSASGGGKYNGVLMRGSSDATDAGDLVMPEGLEEGDEALVLNAAESLSDRHALASGTYHLGRIVGRTDSTVVVVIDVPVSKPVVMHGKIKDDYVLGNNYVDVWRCTEEDGSDAVEVEFDSDDPRQAAMAAAGWRSENLVRVNLVHPVDAIGWSDALALKAGRVIAFVADSVELIDYTDYGIPGEPGNCITYMIGPDGDQTEVHECSQTVVTGASLPWERIRVYGKAQANWTPGSNTVSVTLVDGAGNDLGVTTTFNAFITSPTGNTLRYTKIAANDILALTEMAPGVFHVVNALVDTGMAAVNDTDKLDYLEKQILGDGEDGGNDVWIGMATEIGPDKTPVLRAHHLVGNSKTDSTITGPGVVVAGDKVTITPLVLELDRTKHVIGSKTGIPVSFTRSGGAEVEGDGVFTDTKDTTPPGPPDQPARTQVFHINLANPDTNLDLDVGAVDVDSDKSQVNSLTWSPFRLQRDVTKHVFGGAPVPDGSVSLDADQKHIQLAHGVNTTATVTHMEADFANAIVAVNTVQGFEIVDVSGIKYMRITFIGIHYDTCGHIVGIDPAETLDLALTLLSVDTQTAWDAGSQVLRKKTQIIGVPYAELPSSYITILSGSKCAT